jgi:hypothetical protein
MTPESLTLLEAFAADGPVPELADQLMLFGQFVGSWDLDVVNYAADGSTEELPGEWHFGWALGGRAVADVWICPRRAPDGTSPGEHGTSVRFYDEAIDAWRSTWIGPRRAFVRQFVARAVPGGIALEGQFDEGTTTRWSFGDIELDPGADLLRAVAFRWRNESTVDGATWQLHQTFTARRAA